MINIKEIISEDEFKSELKRLYMLYGKFGKKEFEKYSIYKDRSFDWYTKRFGGLKKICNDIGVNYCHYSLYSKEDIIDCGLDLYNKLGKINKDICVQNGINSSVVRRLFGSYNNFFKELDAPIKMPRFVTKEDLLKDIKGFIETTKCNSSTIYRKYGTYSCTLINKYGGWEHLLSEIDIDTIGESKAEKFIENFLIENNIKFLVHHNFNWLKKNGNNLYVDFYLPEKNLVIEYNGEQHYKYVPYFHKNEENFKKRKDYDEFKYKSIIEHGIKLLIIDYNDDIITFLNKII